MIVQRAFRGIDRVELEELFQSVKDYTPVLLATADRIRTYCEKYRVTDEDGRKSEAGAV